MIKRTIAIDNPSKLSVQDSQLIIEQSGEIVGKIPVEDIEPYALGLCCLQDKQNEPLINAFMQLNLQTRG